MGPDEVSSCIDSIMQNNGKRADGCLNTDLLFSKIPPKEVPESTQRKIPATVPWIIHLVCIIHALSG